MNAIIVSFVEVECGHHLFELGDGVKIQTARERLVEFVLTIK